MRFFTQTVLIVACLVSFGCAIEPATNQPQSGPVASPSSAPAPSPVQSSSATAKPITLPVLDAFFADDAFAAALKSRLQLSDDQISRLKEVAHAETANLVESQLNDGYGDSASARADAEEKIKAIIGEDKSKELTALVNERWAGDDAGDTTAKPNAVPSDSRIVVNAPAYRMDVFDEGRLVKSYKIGIGYPQFPLPTGERKARTIVFNPT